MQKPDCSIVKANIIKIIDFFVYICYNLQYGFKVIAKYLGRRFALLQNLGYLLEKPKQVAYVDMTERFINARAEYILNFTNNIIRLTLEGKTYYFREAKPHAKSLKDCVMGGVKAFFEEVANDDKLCQRVLDSLAMPQNMHKITNIGSKEKHGSNFNKYLTSGDETCLGFCKAESEQEKKVLRSLAFYLYGEIYAHEWNCRVKSGQLQTFTVIRTLGVYAIARLLDIGEIIAGSQFVKISVNGHTKYGVLSSSAEGNCRTDVVYKERIKRLTPQLLRSFTDLNILDFISCDTDHRVGNYNVVEDENGAYVCVISYDNDSPPTFRNPFLRVRNPMSYSPLIAKNGCVNRVGISKKTADALLKIDRQKINDALSEYLDRLQISGVWSRIKKLQKAVRKTVDKNPEFLIAKEDWGELHVKAELSGAYGKTYMCSFVSEVYFESGLHDFDTL